MAVFDYGHVELLRVLTEDFDGKAANVLDVCDKYNKRFDLFCRSLQDLEFVGYVIRVAPTYIRPSMAGAEEYAKYGKKSNVELS